MEEEKLNRLEGKVDSIKDDITDLTIEVKTGFAQYNASLDRHIEGVEQNRAAIKQVREEVDEIKAHVEGVRGFFRILKTIFWVAGGLSAAVGTLWAVFKFLMGQ